MSVTIATWNINSVRLRINLVGRFLDRYQPDILCLQEIKCRAENFPYKPLRRRGYHHILVTPAGGDEPDPAINPKFAHKLAFLDEMKAWLTGKEIDRKAILVGDLNVAPYETDVWSHKQLLRVVSHTPVETAGLETVRRVGGWVDAVRHLVPIEEKLFTWRSYSAADWQASDRGRRLDHIWVTPHLAGRLESVEVVREARSWRRPSDHVPVLAKIGNGP